MGRPMDSGICTGEERNGSVYGAIDIRMQDWSLGARVGSSYAVK